MAYDRADYTEFLYSVYANASAATEAARKSYIGTISAVAMRCRTTGKLLNAASFGSSSSSYGIVDGWTPSKALHMCAWARGFISEATDELAVASVPPAVKYLSTSFSGVAR